MASEHHADVVIVGGGVAGLSAGIFTARHDLETAILSTGSSLLRRNAHLENYPGFPAGVDARLFLTMMTEQAERAGCTFHDAEVTRIDVTDAGFAIETASENRWVAESVIAATKNTTDYLRTISDIEIIDHGEQFVETDDRGRTGVDGLYAAGRLAAKPHQAIIAAGHGAEVAVTLLEDHDRGFYHDWVAPQSYFTGRGIDVPPGCEEIDEAERQRREQESIELMQDYFSDPYPETPEQHPHVE